MSKKGANTPKLLRHVFPGFVLIFLYLILFLCLYFRSLFFCFMFSFLPLYFPFVIDWLSFFRSFYLIFPWQLPVTCPPVHWLSRPRCQPFPTEQYEAPWEEETGLLTASVLLNVQGSNFIFRIISSDLWEAPYVLARSDLREVNNENREAIFMHGWHHCFSLVRLLLF
jgi:hypothetical protein